MENKLRLAMLISGGGTTAQAIIRATKGIVPAEWRTSSHWVSSIPRIEPAVLIASSPKAGGITRAADEGIRIQDIVIIKPARFAAPELFGESIITECRARSIDLIGQYGWMPKTPANVIAAYSGRMINQHPGPLDPGRPDFGGWGMFGLRVHAARLFFVRKTNRAFFTEATAQRVHPEFDRGAVLERMVIPIEKGDSPISLQARLLPFEHAVQVQALACFAEDRLRELTRDEPLVRPEEEAVLAESKETARLLFPQG